MKSEGVCSYCKKTFSGRSMAKHLEACAERKKQTEADKSNGKVFLIKAGCGPYWVYFEADADSTLKEIDRFLRNLWLECCGHLSAFTISGENYEEEEMDVALDKVLSEGMKFEHEYDFGSTTSLLLECISEREGRVKQIAVVARNNIPDVRCKCGKPAKQICMDCCGSDEEYLCEECAEEHECGEERLLPYVNSPRTGVCGYCGNE